MLSALYSTVIQRKLQRFSLNYTMACTLGRCTGGLALLPATSGGWCNHSIPSPTYQTDPCTVCAILHYTALHYNAARAALQQPPSCCVAFSKPTPASAQHSTARDATPHHTAGTTRTGGTFHPTSGLWRQYSVSLSPRTGDCYIALEPLSATRAAVAVVYSSCFCPSHLELRPSAVRV